MKKTNAKNLGYKVINEFGFDISSRVYLEIKDNKVIKVIDEFDVNIINIVKVTK